MPLNATKHKDIRQLNLEELKNAFAEMGEPNFRAKQVYAWLWQKATTNFEEMSNLPQKLRQQLNENYVIRPINSVKEQFSSDGTIKIAFNLYDGHLIEGVLIPSPDRERMTACVSSQVGCSLTCKFCATGFLKLRRNLDAAEIFDQVVHIDRLAQLHFGKPLTNIVYMGMGEPLLNYKNVLQSVHYITSPDALGMSAKRITVSTAGIAKMIYQLADDQTAFNLAISLHAATDEKRNEIMPINDSNSLPKLSAALRHYYTTLKRPVTYEYIVFRNFNDSLEDARNLVKFCRQIPSKVNLIEYNTVEGVDFVSTDEDRLTDFHAYLEQNGVSATIRRSRGKDIDAACGQLANKG
jgi:23S rRNA (adenine2503-C2)-methyltransferase